MRSNKTFKHIALIGRAGKDTGDTLDAVMQYLLEQKAQVSIEKNTAELMSPNSLPRFSDSEIPTEIDLMIVVGGDGSLLNAAHCALPNNLPVLGINRGRLGFLTDIHPTDLSPIADVLSGTYQVEKRFLLQAFSDKKQLGIAL